MVGKSVQARAKSSNLTSVPVRSLELMVAVDINKLLLRVKVDDSLSKVGRSLRSKLANQLRVDTKMRVLSISRVELEGVERNGSVGVKSGQRSSLVGKQGRGHCSKSKGLHIIDNLTINVVKSEWFQKERTDNKSIKE